MGHHPVPPHNLDARKDKISPFYNWMSQGHGILRELFRKYQLNTYPEHPNLVVHSVEH